MPVGALGRLRFPFHLLLTHHATQSRLLDNYFFLNLWTWREKNVLIDSILYRPRSCRLHTGFPVDTAHGVSRGKDEALKKGRKIQFSPTTL